MIRDLLRGFGAFSLALVPLVSSTPAPAAQAPRAAVVTARADAVGLVKAVDENRAGCTRPAFRHRTPGAPPSGGCGTRNEVLPAEAVEAPAVGAGCKLAGGRWVSYHDGQEVTGSGALEVIHTVPLAEAWGSGASAWAAARREAYANGQDAAATPAAVAARVNRQKAGKDPAGWLPPVSEAPRRYVGEWVTTKLRRQLTAGGPETEALKVLAEGPCEDTAVRYGPAS